MDFVANFMRFPALSKNFENRLRFDKVKDSLKVGTFFETQCTCSLLDIYSFKDLSRHCLDTSQLLY